MGVQGISEVITTGEVNLDFADVRSVMTEAGTALQGWGLEVVDLELWKLLKLQLIVHY